MIGQFRCISHGENAPRVGKCVPVRSISSFRAHSGRPHPSEEGKRIMHSFCGMWRWVPSLAFVCSVAAGSRLVSGGKVLFDAEGNVTYSATVSELAVKATVACPAPTRVTIWCGRPQKMCS